jgi:nitrate/nitrite-specific signal transduction histidine kinase
MANEKQTRKTDSASAYKITEICTYLRQLSGSLNPDLISKEGMINMIRQIGIQLKMTNLIDVRINFSGDTVLLAPERELLILQIILEATANVIKHAEANTITISLHYQPWNSELAIVDDGKGFEYPLPEYAGNGKGLGNMMIKAHALKGMHNIFSWSGGTLVFVSFPNKDEKCNMN